MKLALAVDTESSDLPAPGMEKGTTNYPWVCELGLVLFDLSGREHGSLSCLVKADGRPMNGEAESIHGISARMTEQYGIGELRALSTLIGFVEAASYFVGFNVAFDRSLLESALMLHGKSTKMLIREHLRLVDLIGPCAAYCKLPTEHESGSYRWPKLDVACQAILNDPPMDTAARHEANADARRAMRLFLALHQMNALDGVNDGL